MPTFGCATAFLRNVADDVAALLGGDGENRISGPDTLPGIAVHGDDGSCDRGAGLQAFDLQLDLADPRLLDVDRRLDRRQQRVHLGQHQRRECGQSLCGRLLLLLALLQRRRCSASSRLTTSSSNSCSSENSTSLTMPRSCSGVRKSDPRLQPLQYHPVRLDRRLAVQRVEPVLLELPGQPGRIAEVLLLADPPRSGRRAPAPPPGSCGGGQPPREQSPASSGPGDRQAAPQPRRHAPSRKASKGIAKGEPEFRRPAPPRRYGPPPPHRCRPAALPVPSTATPRGRPSRRKLTSGSTRCRKRSQRRFQGVRIRSPCDIDYAHPCLAVNDPQRPLRESHRPEVAAAVSLLRRERRRLQPRRPPSAPLPGSQPVHSPSVS